MCKSFGLIGKPATATECIAAMRELLGENPIARQHRRQSARALEDRTAERWGSDARVPA
jgi:hypothetical protein